MKPRVVLWGTYDLGKPRTRIVRALLAAGEAELAEIHTDIWGGVEDKSQLSPFAWATRVARWLLAYPSLLWRYLRSDPHDAVVVPYMGHLDILILWPFARLRGVPIVWDAFLSLYDTVACDRRLISRRGPVARALAGWERLAARAACRVVLDTAAHADMFRQLYDLPAQKMAAVLVGAEPGFWVPPSKNAARPNAPSLRVLFYGQFIPLHGIETIVEAARLARDEPIDWRLIGRGQEASRIRAMMAREPLPRLTWTEWVPFDELRMEIAQADICLGIFGTTRKAARVIPNKVFQVIAAGKPLVTRDSPAMHELAAPLSPGIRLVPPGDAAAILANVKSLAANPAGTASAAQSFSNERLAEQWLRIISDAVAQQQRARAQPRDPK